MLRGVIHNNSGMAASIIAMILLLLNTAVIVVMSSMSERGNLIHQIKNGTALKKNQHVVDTAEAMVVTDCNRIVLGKSGRPLQVSDASLRTSGIDLTQNFVEIYRERGFEVRDGNVKFNGLIIDTPDRMPTDTRPILTSLEGTIVAGQGLNKAARQFMLLLLMSRETSGEYTIHSCENSQELMRCYTNSNALSSEVPAGATIASAIPIDGTEISNFDAPQMYARIKYCFGNSLRLPENCTEQHNADASMLRVCLAIANWFSTAVEGGAPMTGIAGEVCTAAGNKPTLQFSCGNIGGGV